MASLAQNPRHSAFSAFASLRSENPDYGALRAALQQSARLNDYFRLHITEAGPAGGAVEVDDSPQARNIAGSVQAAVLFHAIEIAGSAAAVGAIAAIAHRIDMFVLRDCRVDFLKPVAGAFRVMARVDDLTVEPLRSGPAGRFTIDVKALIYSSAGALAGKSYLEFTLHLVEAPER